MKLWQIGLLCVAVGGLCLMASHGFADEPRSKLLSDGTVGCELSKNLYESTQSLIQGNVGLLVGLVMLLMGFWALINGAAILPAMTTIVMGGLVTALPSLINVTFEGVGNLMSGNMGGVSYAPSDCQPQETEVCDTVAGGGRQCTKMYIYNDHYYAIIQ